jgi:nucleoside-diphosphate-sugar epimerase
LRRVLITGASGFLGASVVGAVAAQGWTTTTLGNSRVAPNGHERLQGDLADATTARALLSRWRWDAVVNLAGPVTGGVEDLQTGIDVVAAHTRIALNLSELAGTARIVHASSMTVYGSPMRIPVDEGHPRRPLHLYGLGKTLAEDVFLRSSLDVSVLRIPGLFSENRRSGALYRFCQAACNGTPLRVTASAPTPWDLLHVEDATTAIVASLDRPGVGAVNVGYGERVELVAIAEMIARHAGKGSVVERNAGVTHPVFQLDVAKARSTLGWSPPTLYSRIERYYAAVAAEAE